jgi:hypothetical protein
MHLFVVWHAVSVVVRRHSVHRLGGPQGVGNVGQRAEEDRQPSSWVTQAMSMPVTALRPGLTAAGSITSVAWTIPSS